MFGLTVVAKRGLWVLEEDDRGEVGAFGSRAEALQAAGDYEARVGEEVRHVLIQEEAGEWEEALVETPQLN